MKPAASIDLLVSSRYAPTFPGGLAYYQNGLLRELRARTSLRATACAALDDEPTPVLAPDPDALISRLREPRELWMSLAARPPFHGILRRWIGMYYAAFLAPLVEQSPRAIHFVGTGWDFFGFAMASLARRCQARFTIWPAVHPGQWGDDKIDLLLYGLADGVFCQSEDEKNHLVQRGLASERIRICGLPPMCLPNGNGDRLRQKLGLGSRPVVLFLGRKSSGKGFPALMAAWSRVQAAHPSAVLLLAGPDDDSHGEISPRDSIRDLGILSEEDKADALAACDVFCLPSAHESFGIVFVEAWSYGKPVVCGPAPASREFIRNGETGLWADQTTGSIADALLRLLGDPVASRRMGEAGRRLQQDSFTWEATLATHREGWKL